MNKLNTEQCTPYTPQSQPLTLTQAKNLCRQLHKDWKIASDGKSIRRSLKFKDFYRTMSFTNALAYLAHSEDHHPDLELGYNYCHVTFATHSVGGLSKNDFICAAKLDRL